MAKRKEVILQEVLNTQELWEEAMSKENLYVVDAHQKWSGPCTAIVGMLKRIKNELGDDLLKFATAEVDSIDSLEQYRGRCEPNFLFFGCGELVAAVRGCNAPLIQETINSTLASEHKVIGGEAERKVIRDVYTESPDQEEEATDEEDAADDGVVPKQVTVALIKPDVVQNEQVDEIIAKIQEAGIEILANDERMLTEEEATEFYKNKSEESYFDDLIKYVTSGPCRVLVLTKGETGQGVVDLWRNIIGPFDAAVAKDEHPESLRSIYGENATRNALHGSSSEEEAVRELGFFYPDFSPPTYSSGRLASRASSRRSKAASARSKEQLKRTLAIIRPDALRAHRDAILHKIEESGFKIAMQKELTLTTAQAEDFYSEHKDKEYFEPLVKQMTCGPVLALCLAHTQAVERWREMLGPKVVSEAVENEPDSLRAQFKVDDEINVLHGSDSPDTAETELAKIFQVDQTLAVIKPDAISEKDQIIEKLKEAGFMISCQKDMSLTKEIASEIYKSKEGSEFYDDLIGHMTSGETLMMVLSAENAVDKLRELMGPADPEEAKANNPNSLRALFAKSIMENAIHSPSSRDSAQEKIKIVFGDTNFGWDGTFMSPPSSDSPTNKSEGSLKEKQDEEPTEENTEVSVNEEESGRQDRKDADYSRASSQGSERKKSGEENVNNSSRGPSPSKEDAEDKENASSGEPNYTQETSDQRSRSASPKEGSPSQTPRSDVEVPLPGPDTGEESVPGTPPVKESEVDPHVTDERPSVEGTQPHRTPSPEEAPPPTTPPTEDTPISQTPSKEKSPTPVETPPLPPTSEPPETHSPVPKDSPRSRSNSSSSSSSSDSEASRHSAGKDSKPVTPASVESPTEKAKESEEQQAE